MQQELKHMDMQLACQPLMPTDASITVCTSSCIAFASFACLARIV